MTATATPPPYSDTFVYDDYGRLSQKGGSNYGYDPSHPHAVQSALGWVYTYNQSGGVVSKTDGTDTYTFTYTETLKVETVSLNGVELHQFGYDANGSRVSEQRSDGTLIYFVGEYYEYSLQGTEVHEKKYYSREAMREDGTLYFILTDHLGSTSVVTDENGNYLWEMRYDAWGAIRNSSGTSPTEKLYTGQRFSADLNLYDYKARWYDPLVGRFLMEDAIIPQQGVMRLERYAYVMNNPAFYVDPSGYDPCSTIPSLEGQKACSQSIMIANGATSSDILLNNWDNPIHKEGIKYHNLGQERMYDKSNQKCPGCLEFHMSIDAGSSDDPVYSATDGTVVETGWTDDFGNYIIVEYIVLGDPYYIVYAHLGSASKDNPETVKVNETGILVNEGDPVNPSLQIGIAGNTKAGTQDGKKIENGLGADGHLHFEVRTSLNINLINKGDPFSNYYFWGYTRDQYPKYFVDLGKLYEYDPDYEFMPQDICTKKP